MYVALKMTGPRCFFIAVSLDTLRVDKDKVIETVRKVIIQSLYV